MSIDTHVEPVVTDARTLLPRLLPPADSGPSLPAHTARHGSLAYQGSARILIDEVERAGITGRGGAAFPTARKMRAVAKGRRPVVVANGAEGEPAAAKDKTLLRHSPHLVLDGLQLAAEAVGAKEAYLYVHQDTTLVRSVEHALHERSVRGIDRVAVEIVTAPARFLAGEESALVSRVEGGAALPRTRPPAVYEAGVRGRPTLVQNVETLAHVALVARYGADWFRQLGTPEESGSMLVTVHRDGLPVHVVEAARGMRMTAVLGPLDDGAQAVLVGGYHGAWIPAERARELRLLDSDLRPYGAALGAGVLAVLPSGRCGVRESARVMTYLALESAGQCGPCLNGLPRIAAALERLAAPAPAPTLYEDLRRWSGLVVGRGACHHPAGSVRFLSSTLTVFADELALHAAGRCSGWNDRPFLPTTPAAPDDHWN